VTELNVSVPGGHYSIQIEAGLLPHMAQRIESVHRGRRGLVVMDHNVVSPHGSHLLSSFNADWNLSVQELVATESNKKQEAVSGLHQACLEAGLDRGSLVIGFGGGITGDVSGFTAATFLRGISLVLIPTTLLAMVDAAVGGKTGVNLPLPGGQGLGKNLAGAFWQPQAVLIDPLVLSTLSERDLRCGLAECIKHGFIGDPGLLELIHENRDSILAADPLAITDLVERALRVKIGVIEEDERETGGRAALNFGHTFGHGMESVERLELRHGEAVAIGMIAATQCAFELGRVGPEMVDQAREIVQSVGLPHQLPEPVDVHQLMSAMQFDKKTLDGHLRLVLPGDHGVEIVTEVPAQAVESAWAAVGASC
tara:strand:- start:623 stop:1726 length:1104 start_codon:yes stop_codon:yes gene_type:complete